MQHEHPFLVPDILLHITHLILSEASTVHNRWKALLRISRVNKTTYAVLTDQASLWRWVDLSSPSQVAVMLRRMKGRTVRPVVTFSAEHDLTSSSLDSITASFQDASPILQPEALYEIYPEPSRTFRKHFPSSLHNVQVWCNLRVLVLRRSVPVHDQHALFPLDCFQKLEILHLANYSPVSDSDSPVSFPSLRQLILSSNSLRSTEPWFAYLKYMPNLDELSLNGHITTKKRDDDDHTLAVIDSARLRKLWIQIYSSVNQIELRTPMLEHMTFLDPIDHAAPQECLTRMVCRHNHFVT